MVKEPSSKYIGYVTPLGGSGEDIAKTMHYFIKNKNTNLSLMKYINQMAVPFGAELDLWRNEWAYDFGLVIFSF